MTKQAISLMLGIALSWSLLTAFSPQSSRAAGVPVHANSTVHGTLNKNHTVDLWDLTLPRDGSLKCTLTKDATLSAGVNLLPGDDPSGKSDIAFMGGNTLVYPQAGKGHYIIQVIRIGSGFGESQGSYSLAIAYTPNAGANDPHTTSSTARTSAISLAATGPARGHLGYFLGKQPTGFHASIFDDSDLYKITLPSNGSLSITAKTDAALPSVRLELWNAKGDKITGEWNAVGNPQLSRGTYYLNVTRQDAGYNGNYGAYTLTSKMTPPSLPEYKPNPLDAKHAAPLALGKIISGNLGYMLMGRDSMGQFTYTNTNWFRIGVRGTGMQLRVDVATEATMSSATIALFDASGIRQIASANGSGSAVLYLPTTTPGTYLVSVTRADPCYAGNYGAYRLRVLSGKTNLQSAQALHIK